MALIYSFTKIEIKNERDVSRFLFFSIIRLKIVIHNLME
jgi:hypothetical protein